LFRNSVRWRSEKDSNHQRGSILSRNRLRRKTYPKIPVVLPLPAEDGRGRMRHASNTTSAPTTSERHFLFHKRSNPTDLPAWVLVAPKGVDAAASDGATPLAADEWLTLAEVAQYLRLSKRTVSRMIKAGRLPAKRVGKAVRIARSQLMTMLTSLPPVSEEAGECRE